MLLVRVAFFLTLLRGKSLCRCCHVVVRYSSSDLNGRLSDLFFSVRKEGKGPTSWKVSWQFVFYVYGGVPPPPQFFTCVRNPPFLPAPSIHPLFFPVVLCLARFPQNFSEMCFDITSFSGMVTNPISAGPPKKETLFRTFPPIDFFSVSEVPFSVLFPPAYPEDRPRNFGLLMRDCLNFF